MARTGASKEIEILVRARYPILYVVSWEESRVENALIEIAKRRRKRLYMWTATSGLYVHGAKSGDNDSRQPLVVLDRIMQSQEQALFVLKDFHPYLKDDQVIRKLRDLVYALKLTLKTLILVSPVLELPPEIEKEITVVDYELPSYDDLGALLDRIRSSVEGKEGLDVDLTPEDRDRVIRASQGLTLMEAENVLARSIVEAKKFDVNIIVSEKQQIIRKSQVLDYYHSSEEVDSVGGLDILKDWLGKRTNAFGDRARQFGLPEPKGLLLLGVQGCGKSLTAKAVANLWRLPLLKLDVGRIFAGLVGKSEENMRKAIRIAESVAPCVLWVDEIEKGLSGAQSSGASDAGTTARVFGTFLTWLQEKTAPVFVIATANDISQLPPELLRKGRFDDIFFVDLPTLEERIEILRIHLEIRGRDASRFDLTAVAEACVGFSGAEIEQVVVAGMYDAFDRAEELTEEDIIRACEDSIPLSATMSGKISSLRAWARLRARKASSGDAVQLPRLPDEFEDLLRVAGMYDEGEPAYPPDLAPEPEEVKEQMADPEPQPEQQAAEGSAE
jgi:SpoVK/Ycf46/Vps4 family AAA+-type ATPase